MSESSGRWIKGCALGCGGMVVFFVLFILGMSFSMRSAFDDAHHDRQILEELYGDDSAFVPSIDGTFSRERMEAFLTVRDALGPIHTEVESADREMADFEALAEDGEPKMREALPAVFSMTKTMMGLPWIFGEIERTRNRALVEADMGLGEYTYIFVIAYHRDLVEPEAETNLFSGSPTNRRVREELRAMLGRQLESARVVPDADEEWVATLASEVAALDRDSTRVPWQDGLPDQIAACVQPFLNRLGETYSPATAEFELLNSTVSGGGMRIEMN